LVEVVFILLNVNVGGEFERLFGLDRVAEDPFDNFRVITSFSYEPFRSKSEGRLRLASLRRFVVGLGGVRGVRGVRGESLDDESGEGEGEKPEGEVVVGEWSREVSEPVLDFRRDLIENLDLIDHESLWARRTPPWSSSQSLAREGEEGESARSWSRESLTAFVERRTGVMAGSVWA
jgi:hypothetical protein